jgi:ElaB/YqjD/DUF883 family membrane-anchored ribosome-binding protein
MDKEPGLAAQDPHTIRKQIEETRSSLAEKLETLEHEVKETVCGASSAVVGTVETVKQTLASTVESVRDTVQGTVESVKQTFDVRVQVEAHPWAMFGGSIVAGFAAGALIPSQDRMARAMSRRGVAPAHEIPRSPSHSYFEPIQENTRAWAASSPASRGSQWITQFADRFAPEIDRLKGLAIGSLMGVVRDMVRRNAPEALASELTEVIDNATTKLGGQPIRGSVFKSRPRYSTYSG